MVLSVALRQHTLRKLCPLELSAPVQEFLLLLLGGTKQRVGMVAIHRYRPAVWHTNMWTRTQGSLGPVPEDTDLSDWRKRRTGTLWGSIG